MKTIVFSGSIRSRSNHLDFISNLVDRAHSLQEYISICKKELPSLKLQICNSDILTGAILLAMKQYGANTKHYSLTKLFPLREDRVVYKAGAIIDPELETTDTLALDPQELNLMMEEVSSADGIVLVTPVYFGDRSSVANKILQICGMHNLLQGKIFGAAAVGAKRNGGQETAVIYCLMEALSQQALIVGNGPPTSQYGGTAVGGHRSTVINDTWGLETAFGVGREVTIAGNIIKNGKNSKKTPSVHILVLLTMDDTQGILFSFLKEYLEKAKKIHGNVKFSIINLLDLTIYRCLGCDICPTNNKLPLDKKLSTSNNGHCVIQTKEDNLETVHQEMLAADGIILAGLNVQEHHKLIYRYQVLVERTRFIRRDNFALNHKPMTAFCLNQVGARVNSLHTVKATTSYIRHNTIFHRPVEAFLYENKILDDGMQDLLSYINWTQIITTGIKSTSVPPAEYSTKGIGGY